MPASCEECGRRMAATAAVCPHCGHRQSGAAPAPSGPSAKKPRPISVSKEEAAALLQATGARRPADDDRPIGPAVLFLPSEGSSGSLRALEQLLTLVALPVLLTGLLFALVRPRNFFRLMRTSEGKLTLAIGLSGGFALFTLGSLAGLNGAALWALTLTPVAALLARLALRRRAAS